MTHAEVNRFNTLYQRHLRLLKLQGKSQKTIDAYSRAVRRVSEHFDCCPDQLTPEQLEVNFGNLVDTHSWSTIKIDRNGLQFFWRYVLKRDWQWVNIIKPPKIHTLPDISQCQRFS
jgi:integrase/recombinase XerD